jgi:hypothetical protein
MDEAMQVDERRIQVMLKCFEGISTDKIELLNVKGSGMIGLTNYAKNLMYDKEMLLEMLGALCTVLGDLMRRLEKYEPQNPAAAQALKAAKEAIDQAQNEAGHGYKE